jgi:hypothetical protein
MDNYLIEKFTNHSVDRLEYQRNKQKSNKGGDWWVNSAPVQPIAPAADSTKKGENPILGGYYYKEEQKVANVPAPQVEDADWNQHRRKKQPQGTGKYNIFTGEVEVITVPVYTESKPSGVNAPYATW